MCASRRSTGSSGPSLDADAISATPRSDRVSTVAAAATRHAVRVVLPSWRPDSADEIDVIEEVARHVGYEQLGKTVPSSKMHGRLSPVQQRRRALRQVLLGVGTHEAMPTRSCAGRSRCRPSGGRRRARLEPARRRRERAADVVASRDDASRCVQRVASATRRDLVRDRSGLPARRRSGDLPDEYEALGVVLAGAEAPAAMQIWREMSSAMGVGARIDQGTVPAGMHPTRSATLSLGRDVVGAVGEIDPDVLDAYGVSERVAWLELDLSRLLAIEPKITQWKPISRYPSTDLDFAFVVPDGHCREGRQGDPSGDRIVARRSVAVRRLPRRGRRRGRSQPRLPTAAAGSDRTLADDDIATVQRKVVAGVQKWASPPRLSQFASRWSGALAIQARRPPWRRSTSRHSELGEVENTSSSTASKHDPGAHVELGVELAGRPAGVPAEHPQVVDPLGGVDRLGGEVDRAQPTGQSAQMPSCAPSAVPMRDRRHPPRPARPRTPPPVPRGSPPTARARRSVVRRSAG